MIKFTNLNVDKIEIWAEHENRNGTIDIHWSTDDIGFGTISIVNHEDGTIKLDSEHMSREFVKEVLSRLIDESIMII